MKILFKALIPLLLLISVSSFAMVPIRPKLVTNGNMAGSITSSVFPMWQVVGYSPGYDIQAVYTGTPNGTMALQASLDGVNYSAIQGSSQVIAGAGSFLYNVGGAYYPFVQLTFTPGGGSAGTLNVFSYGKGE